MLRKDDNVIQVSSTPTWHSLISALGSLHLKGIAADIRKERYIINHTVCKISFNSQL